MVLITGGNGCVGEYLGRVLRKRGEAVRVLGLAPSPADTALRTWGIEVAYGDVRHLADIDAAMHSVDRVIHLAAVLFAPENPSLYHEVNVEGTRNTLAAAIKNGVKHFVFVSSISVTYPRHNEYSSSKAKAEEWVRPSKVPWTIVRPCLVLGGAEHQAFVRAVLRWPVLPLPRGGSARKCPFTPEALAEGLANLLDEPSAFGKTLSLGGNEIVSLREMATSLTGKPKRIWPLPEGLLRVGASWVQALSRIFGRRLSWLSHQAVDGLVYDAVPYDDVPGEKVA